jgi:hypothetical protein
VPVGVPALELTVAFSATAAPMVAVEGVAVRATVGVFWIETVCGVDALVA